MCNSPLPCADRSPAAAHNRFFCQPFRPIRRPAFAQVAALLLLTNFLCTSAELAPEWTRIGRGEKVGIPSLLTIDGQENITIAGTEAGALVLSQFTAAGQERWTTAYPFDAVQPLIALASGSAGQAWAAALSRPALATNFSGITVGYDAAGTLSWTRGEDNYVFGAVSLAVDEAGNSHVTGIVSGQAVDSSADSVLTVKYASDGRRLWSHRYSPPKSQFLAVAGSVVDPAGDLIVTGTASFPGGASEFLTLKIDGQGALLWAAEDAAGVLATDLAVDLDGSVAIVGHAAAAAEGLRLVKYSADGHLIWTVVRPPRRGGAAVATKVKFDSDHHLVVTGYEKWPVDEDIDEFDCITIKFDPSGREVWAARSPNYGRIPVALEVDQDGAIYIAGWQLAPAARTFWLKYAPSGDQLDAAALPGLNPGAIALDRGKHLYLVGTGLAPNHAASVIQLRKFPFTPPNGLPTSVITPLQGDAVLGSRFTFTSAVTGSGPFVYQWRRFGFDLPGATNTSLTLTNVEMKDAGAYTLAVSNQNGATLSPESVLRLRIPPIVSVQPRSIRLVSGRPAMLIAEANGDGPLSLQWELNGVPVPGATNAILNIAAASEAQTGPYTLVLSNAYGVARSAPAFLQVLPRRFADDWDWQYPLPQGNDLLAATYGAGRSILGGKNGTLVVSSDGEHWSSFGNESLGHIQKLGFAEGRFVALSDQRGIFSSDNGMDWVERYPETRGQFTGLACGNGAWLAAHRRTLLRSANGAEWSLAPVPVNSRVADVAFGLGQFVAMAGNQSLLSTNGLDWTVHDLALPNASFERIVFGLDRFIALDPSPASSGSTLCAVSLDGKVWHPGELPKGLALIDAAGGAGLFVGLGAATNGGRYLCQSEDALIWQTNSFSFSNEPLRIVHQDNRFLILGDDGGLWTSVDGRRWLLVGGASDVNLRAVASGGGWTVAVGNDGTMLAAGDDGVWNAQPSGTSSNLRAIAYGKAGSWPSEVPARFSQRRMHSPGPAARRPRRTSTGWPWKVDLCGGGRGRHHRNLRRRACLADRWLRRHHFPAMCWFWGRVVRRCRRRRDNASLRRRCRVASGHQPLGPEHHRFGLWQRSVRGHEQFRRKRRFLGWIELGVRKQLGRQLPRNRLWRWLVHGSRDWGPSAHLQRWARMARSFLAMRQFLERRCLCGPDRAVCGRRQQPGRAAIRSRRAISRDRPG
ncbi:MAG: hypothetical protein U1G07_19950 [Verrucomicrobiota bacterium]